ncbi:MAG: hypothetical protein KBF97_02165, partial [Bacteroidetes bacterium]|nr:hypothetical protein [Bacteroidota bacterium]
GEINGNLFTGLTVDTVMMYVDGAPFVESGSISIQYDLLDLLNDRITVDTLTIENPSVHLIRWKNGEWNVNRLAAAPPSGDTAASPLRVSAGRLRIVNAAFHLVDSTGAFDSVMTDRNGRRVINYSDVHLEQVNIELSGMYSAAALSATLHHLSFAARREQFTLLKLSAHVMRTKDSSAVRNLSITTPSSTVELSARIGGVDVFDIAGLDRLRSAEVDLTVAPSTFLSSDVTLFLPSLDFLKGNVTLDGAMQGDFENLSVRSLNASFGGSTVSLSGTVSNIYQPRELRLNVVSSNSTVEPGDLPALMPFFDIPDYSGLGPLSFDLQFVGKPLDFLAIAKVRSAAGTVSVDGQMVITEDNIHYKGILAGEDVKLEKVFASEEFLSRLNTKIFIEGSGTSLATLNSEARIDIDSSMFRNIPIASTTMRIAARDNSIETDLSLRSQDGSVTAKAYADFADDSLPVYYLSAAVRGLDLAPIVRDEHYRSNLSFELERTGAGLTLFDNPSDTRIEFQQSTFQGTTFDSAAVVLQWLKDSTNSDKVIVRSPVVDGTLSGQFTFNGLVDAVVSHLDGFGRLYSNQRRIVDTSYAQMLDSAAVQVQDSGSFRPASITYDLTMKNLVPLSVVFNFPRLEIVGTASGVLNAGVGEGSSSGTIAVERGIYADTSSPIGLKHVRLEYQVKNLAQDRFAASRDSLELMLKLRGDEIGISNTALRMAALEIDIAKQKGRFSIASDVDSMLNFSVSGGLVVTEQQDKVLFDTLYAKYQGIDLSSAGPFVLTVSSRGVHVDSARLIRRDEDFFLSGNVDFQGNIKAEANIRNFDLSDIFFINTSRSYREQTMELGGKIDLTARVTGTAASPVIIAQLEGDDISYRNSTFGDLTAALKYAKRKAGIKVELAEPDSVPVPQSFSMEGVVPIDLTFLPVDERLDFDGMDLKVTAGNLSASIFDIFVPEIDEMQGRVTGSVGIIGSLVKPQQKGAFTIDSGSFRLEMNGIHYRVGGTIAMDSGKILFPDFSIRNMEDDYTEGLVTVGGHILLDGFAPAEYHLTANGELLVLNNRSLTANQSFFGRLIGQTGPNGLRFEGTFERSRIAGNIFVQDAFMTFPPSQKTVSVSGMRFDDIIFIDDTSIAVQDTAAAETEAAASVATAAAPKESERTFLDGFGYELGIETRNNVRVQMIFNANAGAYEELVAELNGKMVLKKDEAGQQLIGTINVGDGSNYQYYKKFKATGSLTFVGDPQNPQLNILAKYSGTHLKNIADPTSAEGVVVSLEITGNRANPKIKIGLATVDPNDPNSRETPRQGDVENDAIAFLLTSTQSEPGLFREELTALDRNKLGAQLNEAISGTFVNNLLSGLVNDFIEKNNIPFVKRVEVRNVMASDPDIVTRLEVSSAVISIGGKVFTDVSNTNVSVQMPVLGRQNRNFIFEVEKKTENADYTSAQAKTILGARLFYRFTF